MTRALYLAACAVPVLLIVVMVAAIAAQALRADPYPTVCAGYSPSDCPAAAMTGGW